MSRQKLRLAIRHQKLRRIDIRDVADGENIFCADSENLKVRSDLDEPIGIEELGGEIGGIRDVAEGGDLEVDEERFAVGEDKRVFIWGGQQVDICSDVYV